MKELCIKLVIETSLCYDARSEEHQITTVGYHRRTQFSVRYKLKAVLILIYDG